MTTGYRRSYPVGELRWRSCEARIGVNISRCCQLPRAPLGLDWSCACKNSMTTSKYTPVYIDPRQYLPLELPEGIRSNFLEMLINSRCIRVQWLQRRVASKRYSRTSLSSSKIGRSLLGVA